MVDNPPSVNITEPQEGETVIEGATLTVAADVTDDVGVNRVDLLVENLLVDTLFAPPWVFTTTLGEFDFSIKVRATDTAGQQFTDAVNVNVIPDPLTTVVGLVLEPDGSTPAEGATVTTHGVTATTAANGTFSIPDVPTILGNIVVSASHMGPQGQNNTGSSASVAPVQGGITDVETINTTGSCEGDVNNDGQVDAEDLMLVGVVLGSASQGAADLNGDGDVDIRDLVIVGVNFGCVAGP